MPETQTQTHYQALIHGLKACEINYKAHTTKNGPVTEPELNLWVQQTLDMQPNEITRAFKLHINNSPYYPTIADIRNAQNKYNEQPKLKHYKALDAPKEISPMPPKVKKILQNFLKQKTVPFSSKKQT